MTMETTTEQKTAYRYTWDLKEIAEEHLLSAGDRVEIHKASADADEETLSLTYTVHKSEYTHECPACGEDELVEDDGIGVWTCRACGEEALSIYAIIRRRIKRRLGL